MCSYNMGKMHGTDRHIRYIQFQVLIKIMWLSHTHLLSHRLNLFCIHMAMGRYGQQLKSNLHSHLIYAKHHIQFLQSYLLLNIDPCKECLQQKRLTALVVILFMLLAEHPNLCYVQRAGRVFYQPASYINGLNWFFNSSNGMGLNGKIIQVGSYFLNSSPNSISISEH